MPRNLHKKATKQQTRMAALNTLGTPSSSRAGSEVEDELDSVSDTSQITAESAASADDATIADDLRRCVEDLGEKRATTREAALTKLNGILSLHYCGNFFAASQANQEALLQLLCRSLRKPGSPLEALLAARGIALAFVNQSDMVEGDQEELYSMVLPLLKNTITYSLDPQLKHQCIETLAFITFVAASDADTKGGMDYFYKVLVSEGGNIQPDEPIAKNDMEPLLDASLRAYGLLYACIYGNARETWESAWDESESVMPAHLEMLQSTSKAVRVAAGENVALMFDCVNMLRKEVEQQAEEGEIAEIPEYGEIDDLTDALQRLATDSNRRVNKQDRKEQRSAFRDVVKTVENGTRPKHKFKLGHQRLMIRGWAQIMELRAFRQCLGAGLVRHFEENDLLAAVFTGAVDESSESASASSSEEEGTGTGFGVEDAEETSEMLMPSKSAASKRARARHLKRRAKD